MSTASWICAGRPKSIIASNAARTVRPVYKTSSTKIIFDSLQRIQYLLVQHAPVRFHALSINHHGIR